MKASDVPVSACTLRWSELRGDQRSRYCARCDLRVFDLSAHTEDEARALLAAPERPCVRYAARADGSLFFRPLRGALAASAIALAGSAGASDVAIQSAPRAPNTAERIEAQLAALDDDGDPPLATLRRPWIVRIDGFDPEDIGWVFVEGSAGWLELDIEPDGTASLSPAQLRRLGPGQVAIEVLVHGYTITRWRSPPSGPGEAPALPLRRLPDPDRHVDRITLGGR